MLPNASALNKSHVAASVLGLSISMALAMCSDVGGAPDTATLADVEARVAALETQIGKVTVTQVQHLTTARNNRIDGTGEQQWNVASIASSGPEILAIVDDTGNTRTRLVANADCRVIVAIESQTGTTGAAAQILVNGSVAIQGDAAHANTVEATAGAALMLEANDTLTFSVNAGTSATYYFTILAMEEVASNVL
jgi:hypothetical protein